MKKGLVILALLLFEKNSFGQNDLQKCARSFFLSMDTATFQGKDAFMEWHDCIIGKQVADFVATTISGQKIETAKLRGKVIVLNFWMIDCLPCILELPAFNKLVKEYANKDVEFFAVTRETKKRLNAEFYSKYKFDFSMVAADTSFFDLYGGLGYPTTFIIDKTGKVNELWPGGVMRDKDKDDMYLNAKPIIDELLKAE